jgi:superfamily II DNA or RNA helicase
MYDSIVRQTLFQLKFLSVIIDEAHEFRNVGPKHSSALEILQNATIRMLMTATPLQTSTKVRSNQIFYCLLYVQAFFAGSGQHGENGWYRLFLQSEGIR